MDTSNKDSDGSIIGLDENRQSSESLPRFGTDLDSLEVPEYSANIDDTTDTVSTIQPPRINESAEREIFYFSGASGRIISFGTSIQMSMKGKRKH